MYKTETFTETWEISFFLNKENIKQENIISIYAMRNKHVLVYWEEVSDYE